MSTRNIRRRRPPERERSQQALQLRLAGMDYDAIAAKLGYRDHSGPRKAVERLLDRREAEGAARYREVEGDRLDRLQVAVWAQAMRGDLEAVRTCLSIMSRRAKLLGLDAPVSVSFEMSDREFANSVAELFEALGHDGRVAALRELRPATIDAEVVEVEPADGQSEAEPRSEGDPTPTPTDPAASPFHFVSVPLSRRNGQLDAGDEQWSNIS